MAGLFGAAMTVPLLAFCACFVLLLVADVWYVDWAHIREALGSYEIRHALVLSAVTSVVTTVLAVLVAVPAGYALSRFRLPGAMLLDTIVDLSIVLPPLVMGVSLLVAFAMGRAMGRQLSQSEFLVLRFLGERLNAVGELFIYNRSGIVLAQFFSSAALAVRVIKASFDEVDPRTEAVALTLGASRARAFFRVSLPLVRPGVFAGAVLTWARAIGIFGPIMIVAGAVRGHTAVLPTSIYLEISIGRLEVALAISLVMILLSLIALLAFRLLVPATVFGGRAGR